MSTNERLQAFQSDTRIFRPWDSQCAQDNTVSSTSLTTKCNVAAKAISSNENENEGNVAMSCYDKRMLSFLEAEKYVHASSGFYECFEPSISEELILLQSMAPYMTFDMTAIKLMEQEYARVLTEDARTKAANARKQRPKKFKCPQCNVAFSNNGQLRGHIRIHTGERPFKCTESGCGKTFTRNEELTRHKRIHTGLRPFGCSICGKKFGRRDHLKKHLKTHIPPEKGFCPQLFFPVYPLL